MPFYKIPTDPAPHFLESDAFEYLLPAGFALISAEEAEEMRPKPTVPAYVHLRAMEYPALAEYLDGVVKGDQAQIEKYIADCLAVKAKYPKT